MNYDIKIENYIKDHFVEWYNKEKDLGTFEQEDLKKLKNINLDSMTDICTAIEHILYVEKVKYDHRYKQFGGAVSLLEYFTEWCQGLCDPIDTGYFESETKTVELICDWHDITESYFRKVCTLDMDTHRERITVMLYDCILKYSEWSVI